MPSEFFGYDRSVLDTEGSGVSENQSKKKKSQRDHPFPYRHPQELQKKRSLTDDPDNSGPTRPDRVES